MNDKDIFNQTAGMSGPVIAAAFVAGAAGGVIRWITLQESWKTGLATIVASCLMGGFMAPIFSPDIAELFGASILVATSFLAVLIGIVSLTVSNVVIRFTKSAAFLHLLSSMLQQLATAFLRGKGISVGEPSAAQQDPPLRDEEGRP